MSKQVKIIVFIFCIVKLTLHLVADYHSGFQGDELLHIETGKHLAFGFMEFPPFISLLAFIQNLFNSHAVLIHHLFPHIASIVILIVVARTTIELGGNARAVFLVLLGILIAPAFGRTQQLFQPVVFSQLFWVLSFYSLVRFVKYLDKKSLWQLTLFCLLGFLTKYDALFFIFGLLSLVFFKSTRNALIQHKFWLHILVFSVCIVPNVLWQVFNHFPVLQMFARLYQTQLDDISRIANLRDLLIAINPVTTLLLFFTGIGFMFTSKNRSLLLPLAVAIGISFTFLLYKNGKAYYFFPLALTVFPFGAIFLEQALLQKRKWIIYPVIVLMIFGCVLIPFGMPVYSFNRYLSKIYPYEKKEVNGGKYSVTYDEYYTREKWQNTMQELKAVYDSLPVGEKNNCLIWGKHYGQAGAVNLYRDEYHLPPAFSYHGSFYTWAPGGRMPETIIAVSYRVGEFFQPYFNYIKKVRTIYNPYSNNEEELYQYIYICKEPKQDFNKMKDLFKERIFE